MSSAWSSTLYHTSLTATIFVAIKSFHISPVRGSFSIVAQTHANDTAQVPHSDCGSYDLYDDYNTTRGTGLAIPKEELLPIEPRPGTQPCDVFGLNPVMRNLQRLYNQGDAAMLANVGPLVEPITKQEFTEKTKQRPPLLFAHNTQQQIVASVHAQYNYAEGVVGASGVVEARRTHHLPMHYCRSSL